MRYTTKMAVELLDALEVTSSTLAKKDIISFYHKQYGDALVEFLRDVLSPDETFGLDKKTFTAEALRQLNRPDLVEDKYESISQLIDYLKENNTSSTHSRMLAVSFLMMYQDDPDYYMFIIRILLRNLRVGVDSKLVNDALGYEAIKTMKVMLAFPFRDLPENFIVEPKLDGVRAIAIINGNSVEMYTRNGKRIQGYHDIEFELISIRRRAGVEDSRPIVLDGEIWSSDFKQVMVNLFRKDVYKKGIYNVWDILSLEEFNARQSTISLHTRRAILADTIRPEAAGCTHIKVVDFEFGDKDTIHLVMNKYVDMGFEGAMIKDLHAKYEFKRSYAWQKLKPFHTDDFRIIEIEEGTGKYEGTCGAVIVEVGEGQTNKVGSGFDDNDRDLLWNNPEKYIGTYIEVQYQEIIKETGKLRFPSFLRFRPDK